jgi:hypothetical protein
LIWIHSGVYDPEHHVSTFHISGVVDHNCIY